MKKNIFSMGLIAAAALTLTTNCAKTEADFNQAEGTQFELIATSAETKVANDGMATRWSANDQINVFYAEAGSTSYTSAGKFTTATGGSSVTFTGTISGTLNDNNDWYAFYPYDSNLTTPKNTTRYCSVGGNQTQGASATATAHLAGDKFPLYGNAKNVANGTTPTIEMKQAMSVVKVHVTNNSGMGLLVNNVTFSTEDYAIGGQYYIDFSGDTPVFAEKSGSVNKSVTLTVTNGKALVNGASADFYIGIVPFVAASGKKITVKVNDYSKEITLASQATFESGKIKTLNFNYDHVATPASLPFSIDGTGGSAAYSSTDGLSSYGIGSDYASGNSPYLVKFDGTGDYVQVFFDKSAAKVGFGVKMIGGNKTTHIDVTGSSDGLSFTQIQRFTISGSQNDVLNFETTEEIDAAYRFIRIAFDKGSSGSNVGLGPVSISLPSTDPVILASNITGVAVMGTTTTFAYTINNFTAADDVSVKEVDGAVVTSAVVTAPGTVSYTVSANYGTGSANGSITLTSANEGIDKVVSVTQVGETFSTNAPSTITLAKNSGTDSFTITTPSYGWSSTVTPEDGMNLTISPTSGDANSNAQTITINSTTAATANEQTLGTIVIYRNGNSSDPQKKTIVVKKAANAVGTSWVLTALADLTSSDEFVIVGNGRSMSNGNGTANPPSAAAAVTVSNGVITSTVTDAITWTLQGNSTDGYTFYPKGVTDKWLYCTTTAKSGTNNNMRIGTGTRKVFVLEKKGENNYLVTKDSNTKRYVCVYNDSDWRGYVESSIVATDTKFYKKVTE